MQLLPTFDSQNPPDPKLIDACVHCGFCLSTCPSYRIIGKEADSPRGRIYLMDAVQAGQIPLSEGVASHFDTCLGCLACVTTCPSGVQYDRLIAAIRPQIERNQPRSLWEQTLRQFLFRIFPYPDRLRALLAPLWAYQKSGMQSLLRASGLLPKLLPRSLWAMESILPTLSAASFVDNFPKVISPSGQVRYRVGMITGCVQRVFQPQVNAATIRVLVANGCEVVIPEQQGCCGALACHQGQEEQGQELARQTIDTFADPTLDFVIINAAGCGHTLKEYGHLLANDANYTDRAPAFVAKVRDIHEFLIEVGITAKLHPIADESLTIVYQDACHLLHGQKISLQPRSLLKKIPGIQLKEPIDAALCCGSAGVYNILQSEIAEELGKQKVENLLNTNPDLIASPNVGCALQIRKHLSLQNKSIPVFHPIELLDRSIGFVTDKNLVTTC